MHNEKYFMLFFFKEKKNEHEQTASTSGIILGINPPAFVYHREAFSGRTIAGIFAEIFHDYFLRCAAPYRRGPRVIDELQWIGMHHSVVD